MHRSSSDAKVVDRKASTSSAKTGYVMNHLGHATLDSDVLKVEVLWHRSEMSTFRLRELSALGQGSSEFAFSSRTTIQLNISNAFLKASKSIPS